STSHKPFPRNRLPDPHGDGTTHASCEDLRARKRGLLVAANDTEHADEPDDLDPGPDPPGTDNPRLDVRLRRRLRQGVKGAVMIWLAALVTGLLFIYLLAALLRPEWF